MKKILTSILFINNVISLKPLISKSNPSDEKNHQTSRSAPMSPIELPPSNKEDINNYDNLVKASIIEHIKALKINDSIEINILNLIEYFNNDHKNETVENFLDNYIYDINQLFEDFSEEDEEDEEDEDPEMPENLDLKLKKASEKTARTAAKIEEVENKEKILEMRKNLCYNHPNTILLRYEFIKLIKAFELNQTGDNALETIKNKCVKLGLDKILINPTTLNKNKDKKGLTAKDLEPLSNTQNNTKKVNEALNDNPFNCEMNKAYILKIINENKEDTLKIINEHKEDIIKIKNDINCLFDYQTYNYNMYNRINNKVNNMNIIINNYKRDQYEYLLEIINDIKYEEKKAFYKKLYIGITLMIILLLIYVIFQRSKLF